MQLGVFFIDLGKGWSGCNCGFRPTHLTDKEFGPRKVNESWLVADLVKEPVLSWLLVGYSVYSTLEL